MPESRDYYRGAIRVLLDIAESMNCPADHELIDEQIATHKATLSALPPAEPAPDLWGLVEELRGKIIGINSSMEKSKWQADCDHSRSTCNSIGCNGQYFEMVEELAKEALALIAAARQKRGA